MGPPPAGSILGERYVLSAKVGEAPGYVEYRTLDRELEVEMALWWLRPSLFPDGARQDSLLGAGVELRALQDLALRRCFGVGRGTGGLWVTWQLATGAGPAPIAGQPVAIEELRRWLAAVGQGLAALHAQGFAHGRLAPADVVSIGGVLKLGGGGLWRDVDGSAAARAWVGHDHHLSPEVRRGEVAMPTSDVWSMAAIALEMIAGVHGTQPDLSRVAARRHPGLTAVLVGAMNADPGRRPEAAALAEAAANAAAAPYQDLPGTSAPRGKPVVRGGDAGTLVGHAAGPGRGRVPSVPPPIPKTSATPTATTLTGVPPRPGAYSPEPASFALPTPPVAPAPRPQRSAMAVHAPPPAAPVVAPQHPTPRPPAPVAVMPTPARTAIAGAIDRARTAPPGEFVVAAVSLKPGGAAGRPEVPSVPLEVIGPGAPSGKTPMLMRPKMRNISDAQGGRAFAMAPGQMGYLAPPKAVSDARERGVRRWWLIAIVLAVVAAGAGVAVGLLI